MPSGSLARLRLCEKMNPAVWEQNFISISKYNCFQRGKDVISRIYEHIPSQPDYFRIHFFHLAAQEFGIKNGIIKGKGKALATQGKFSKSTPYMDIQRNREAQSNSLCNMLWTETDKKGIPARATEHQPNYLFSIITT